jgi:hypothetical protein
MILFIYFLKELLLIFSTEQNQRAKIKIVEPLRGDYYRGGKVKWKKGRTGGHNSKRGKTVSEQ